MYITTTVIRVYLEIEDFSHKFASKYLQSFILPMTIENKIE